MGHALAMPSLTSTRQHCSRPRVQELSTSCQYMAMGASWIVASPSSPHSMYRKLVESRPQGTMYLVSARVVVRERARVRVRVRVRGEIGLEVG